MIVVHAPGSGLGHLTRAVAVHHTLGWSGEVVVLCSSSRAAHLPLPPGMSLRPIPAAVLVDRATLRSWLTRTLCELEADEVWVDAFPAGIRGELDADLFRHAVRDRPVHHLARLLRWDRYRTVIGDRPPHFASVQRVEPLHPAHAEALARWGGASSDIALCDPAPGDPPEPVEPGTWLVVHAGDPAETAELVRHAEERREIEGATGPLRVISPEREPTTVPAWPLFAGAARVVTAAGCNSVRQLAASGVAHHVVPFRRRWDDQHERARRARRMGLATSTAGR